MYARGRRITRNVIGITSVAAAALLPSFANAQDAQVSGPDVTPQEVAPGTTCDTAGIGQANLVSDLPTLPSTTPPNDTSVTITSVSTGTTGGIPYCLVKLLVKPAINIWVGLPMGGTWNRRLQSEGGGGYAGSVGIPTGSIAAGYIGVQTDTGHTGGSGSFGCVNDCAGATQASPGMMDKQRQSDFAYRSEHLMASLGKQLAQAFYGQLPVYSYWNGCSTGGRQGLRIAQQFPNDYNGILAGAPAIHWDRFQAYQIWPQVTRNIETGGASYTTAILNAKQALATNAAIAACDMLDGVQDGLLTDPRKCTYNPVLDPTITSATCTTTSTTCLTPGEATAFFKTWDGARNTSGKLLWYGVERGAALSGLAGVSPFSIATAQPQFWVYFYPQWDWHTLNYNNYEPFFNLTQVRVGPIMGSDNPNLTAFRNTGGKILTWQGWADQLIMPQGSTSYYENVANLMAGGDYSQIRPWFRHFMAPGVGHCGGGSGPQPQNLFQAVVNWVENGVAPDTITATGGGRTRPLCPYPTTQTYIGGGADPNLASSFVCQ